jgi:hypothetical protein
VLLGSLARHVIGWEICLASPPRSRHLDGLPHACSSLHPLSLQAEQTG